MAFWGVEVKPRRHFKLFPNSRKGRLHVSQAVLGIGSSMDKSIVQCNVGKKSGSVFICCLVPNKFESSQLNLEFEEVDTVVFSVIGSRSVHITGFYINNSSSSSQDKSEESYGVDIENSDSEEYRSVDDDDEYEDDSFIVPDSPRGSDHGKDVEEEKPVDKKRKRVYEVAVSDVSENGRDNNYIAKVEDEEAGVSATTKMSKHIDHDEEKEILCSNKASAVEKESSKKKKKNQVSDDDMINNDTTRSNCNNNNINKGGDGKEEKEVAARSITLPNGLLIEDIQLGNIYEKVALHGKKVSVHFTCKIKGNEQVVNSNLGRKPLKFHLGLEEIMGGWDDGIVGMRVGGKRRLTVPPLLWKGKGDECKKIRSKASLVYEIHLLRVSG